MTGSSSAAKPELRTSGSRETICRRIRIYFAPWATAFNLLRRLSDRDDPVRSLIPQNLMNTTRPADLDLRDGSCTTQAEVYSLVARGLVAAARSHSGKLFARRSRDSNLRSDGVAVALHTNQIKRNPVVWSVRLVQQDPRRAIV